MTGRNQMTTKHKHHHSSSTRVDFKKQRVHLDGKTYRWEFWEGGSTSWDRASSTQCKKDGKIVDFVPKEKRGNKYTWDKVWRELDEKKDRNLIHQLDQLREKHVQKTVLANEAKTFPDDDSSSADETEATQLTPWQKREKQGPPAKGKRVERTKYGVRVFSSDGRTYWDVCVNNSTKYQGGSAVRITLPPARKDGKRWNMAVFDLEAMEAIRREFARGERP
jgi:hypothetical protein